MNRSANNDGLYRNSLITLGIGGILRGFHQCSEVDKEVIIDDLREIIPETALGFSVRDWSIPFLQMAIKLTFERGYENFMLLGNELSFLEALASLNHAGIIQILSPDTIEEHHRALIESNTPELGSVTAFPPGFVPIVPRSFVVLTVAFDAGGGYLMIEQNAAKAIGAIKGQRFMGEVVAMLPSASMPVHERPLNWKMIKKDQFSCLCYPNGYQENTPNL